MSPLNILAPDYHQALPDYASGDTYLNIRQTLSQPGACAQDQIAFGGWRATLGIREDAAEATTTNLMPIPNSKSEQSDHAATYHAGLLYLFDNGVAPYVSYSTSFNPTNRSIPLSAQMRIATRLSQPWASSTRPASNISRLGPMLFSPRRFSI